MALSSKLPSDFHGYSLFRICCIDGRLGTTVGPTLVNLGLRVEGLSGEGRRFLRSATTETGVHCHFPIAFALALAKTNSWILLTGDRALRELADSEAVSCHGVLWLLDRMFDHQVIDPTDLCDGLEPIAGHPRCRLPESEVRKRLRSYV